MKKRKLPWIVKGVIDKSRLTYKSLGEYNVFQGVLEMCR